MGVKAIVGGFAFRDRTMLSPCWRHAIVNKRERERETQTDDLHYPYCHNIDHPYPCLLVEVLVNCAKEKERDEGLFVKKGKNVGVFGGQGVVLVCALERYEKYFTVVLRVKYFTSFNWQIFSQLRVFFKFN